MNVIPFVNEYFAIGFASNRIDVILLGHAYFITWGKF